MSDIQWGPPIAITPGNKPEWLGDEEPSAVRTCGEWFGLTYPKPSIWSFGVNTDAIRLRHDHPHYTQTLRERMELLVRKQAGTYGYFSDEARAIVAELDKDKIDPDLLIVREEVASITVGSYADELLAGRCDEHHVVRSGLAIAKRIRKECGQ